VVLNSCEGARTSHVDPFSGVGTTLIEFGIPAVIGMQFEITDEAAIAFSASLYRALAQGLPVDAAIGAARCAIVAEREAEFGTPVLFLRAADARLSDLESSALLNIAAKPVSDLSDTSDLLRVLAHGKRNIATLPGRTRGQEWWSE
jgi:CHAT domain